MPAHPRPFIARKLCGLTVSMLFAVLASSCGGGDPQGIHVAGVGTGGTGSTGTSAFAGGPISAFGSIVVNGIHFDPTSATVVDGDDQPATAATLQLGTMVEVDAGPVSQRGDRTEAAAIKVRLSSALLGPVDSVNTATQRLSVMGQIVEVGAQTHFGTDLPLGLASLNAGDAVEVYGPHNPQTDRFVATRIERKATPLLAYRVSGVLQDLDLVNNTCRIGQQRISYTWRNPPGNLANGQVVVGYLQTTPAGGEWQAIGMREAAPLVTEDRDVASLTGLVTATTGTTGLFSVNGIPVDAREGSCPVCATLQAGDALSVTGRLSAGVVKAIAVGALPAP